MVYGETFYQGAVDQLNDAIKLIGSRSQALIARVAIDRSGSHSNIKCSLPLSIIPIIFSSLGRLGVDE